MKNTIFILVLFLMFSESFAQSRNRAQSKNIDPIFPLGIRFSINLKTGKPYICDLSENKYQVSDPEYASISELACYIYFADSTMRSLISHIVNTLGINSKEAKKLSLEQSQWRNKTKATALKASEEFKGGTMEISEIYRVTYIKIIENIDYLKQIEKSLKPKSQ